MGNALQSRLYIWHAQNALTAHFVRRELLAVAVLQVYPKLVPTNPLAVSRAVAMLLLWNSLLLNVGLSGGGRGSSICLALYMSSWARSTRAFVAP